MPSGLIFAIVVRFGLIDEIMNVLRGQPSDHARAHELDELRSLVVAVVLSIGIEAFGFLLFFEALAEYYLRHYD